MAETLEELELLHLGTPGESAWRVSTHSGRPMDPAMLDLLVIPILERWLDSPTGSPVGKVQLAQFGNESLPSVFPAGHRSGTGTPAVWAATELSVDGNLMPGKQATSLQRSIGVINGPSFRLAVRADGVALDACQFTRLSSLDRYR